MAAEDIGIKRYIDPTQLQNDLSFSDVDLTSAMMSQASLYAHYGVITANAKRQVDQTKMRMEIVEARLDKEIRDNAIKDGSKVTEAAVSKEIQRSAPYVKAQLAYHEAKMVAELAISALEAFKQRRDMIVQLGITAREELKGEVAIKAKETREMLIQSLKDRALEIVSAT